MFTKRSSACIEGSLAGYAEKIEQNLSRAVYSEYENISQQLGSVPITAVENAQQKCIAIYEQQKAAKM